MIALLDVNVLVALAWPNHVHHDPARRWFRLQKGDGWATCPTTENGFIRVSSNTRIIPQAKTPSEAAQLLRDLIKLEGHAAWPEESSVLDDRWVKLKQILTPGQVTDAQLLSLALRRNGRLATFDRGVLGLVPAGMAADQAVQLIPPVVS